MNRSLQWHQSVLFLQGVHVPFEILHKILSVYKYVEIFLGTVFIFL